MMRTILAGIRQTEHLQNVDQRELLTIEVLVLSYITTIVAISVTTGPFYLLFPELAALSYQVLNKPRGHWGRNRWDLATNPSLAGFLGVFVTRTVSYNVVSVFATVGAILLLLYCLGSEVHPSLSAGVLPLALNITTWIYPVGILFSSVLLVLLLQGWEHVLRNEDSSIVFTEQTTSHDMLQGSRFLRDSLLTLGFTLLGTVIVRLTGWRFVLYPPLIVLALESFRSPDNVPWSEHPFRLALVCFLTSLLGYTFCVIVGVKLMAILTAFLTLLGGMIVFRVLKLAVPPALAVSLIPLIIEPQPPPASYALEAGIGTLLLSVCFLVFKNIL